MIPSYVIEGDEEVYLSNLLWYNVIREIVKEVKPTVVVEFGTRAGYSARVVRDERPYALIYSFDCDFDPPSRGFYRHAINIVSDLRFNLVNTRDLTHIPKCDLGLVDADHTYDGCIHELQLMIKSTNRILVDDYHDPQVQKAITNVIRINPNQFTIKIIDNRVVDLEKINA